jgi:DNA-binding SARP family transcriptional activator/pimeloyl-ACP methyl ester carboxylesterase
MAMEQLSLHLFGAPQIEYGGERISPRFQKELALLIYLAVTNRPHTRLALATLLWPEHDQERALAALRRAIYQIKIDVGEGILDVNRGTIRLASAVDVQVDTQAFLVAAHLCREHSHPPQAPFASCVAALEAAVRLYVDDFLAGFSIPDSAEFDEWQFFEREGLRAECLRVLAMLTSYYEHQRSYDQAIEMARRWLIREPYHEPAHRALIRLCGLSGQYAEASRQYDLCQRLLFEQLGVQPQQETQDLYLAIKEGARGPAMRRGTQYVRNGTSYLAYQSIGEGDSDLLVIGGFISHVEQIWEEPDLAAFLEQLSRVTRIIVYDKRGLGLSDRVGTTPSLDEHVGDALAIARAMGSTRTVVLSVSDGAPISIRLAVEHPEQIAGLVIYGGQPVGVQSVDFPWGLTSAQYQRWVVKLVSGWGGPVNLEYFAPSRAHEPRLRQWWAQMQRLASSPGAVQAILEGMRDTDVRPLLHQIRVPTLILHRRGDRCVPVEAGRYLAAHIPEARYVELPGEDHWWWVGETDLILEEIGRFVRQRYEAVTQTT